MSLPAIGVFAQARCGSASAQLRSDIKTAVSQLGMAIVRATQGKANEGDAQRALSTSAFTNPSCETAHAAWHLAAPFDDDTEVYLWRHILSVLMGQTTAQSSKALVFGAGLLVGGVVVFATTRLLGARR